MESGGVYVAFHGLWAINVSFAKLSRQCAVPTGLSTRRERRAKPLASVRRRGGGAQM
ncbi:hypothetical protein GCM10009563_24410 [Subtercola frigoramans]